MGAIKPKRDHFGGNPAAYFPRVARLGGNQEARILSCFSISGGHGHVFYHGGPETSSKLCIPSYIPGKQSPIMATGLFAPLSHQLQSCTLGLLFATCPCLP
eukprot:scaffold188513_cov19-Tisochrysis_lutea.AAC.1